MSASADGPRTIRCPGCGGASVYAASNPHRPFCSARCRNNDLGAWANEAYAVEADAGPQVDPVEPSGRDDALPH